MEPRHEWARLCEELRAAQDRLTRLTGERLQNRFATPEEMIEIGKAADDIGRLRDHMSEFVRKHA